MEILEHIKNILMIIFTIGNWQTFELFNGELIIITDIFNNEVIKICLIKYISSASFKTDLLSQNIAYKNEGYYLNLIDLFCKSSAHIIIPSKNKFPELSLEEYETIRFDL